MLASMLAAAGTAAAGLTTPARVTLDGVGGARPGMSVAAVSARWGVPLRPNYEVRATCGTADIERPGIAGQAIFMPRGRFGAVFFRKGAVTGRGIRIGSTLAQLQRAYPKLSSRPDRVHPRRPQLLSASHARPALGAAPRREPGEARHADRVRRTRVRASRRRVRLARTSAASSGRVRVPGRPRARVEQVAALLDPLERLADPEAARRQVLRQLVPAKRRRDRRARLRPHRVDRGDRLPRAF